MQVLVPVYIHHPSLYPVIQKFFDSLRESYPDIEVIACDDCSPLPIPDNWNITLRNETNLGFTGNVNRLLKHSTADKLIVCNDDLVIKRGDLDWIHEVNGLMIGSPRDTASSPDDTFGAIFGLTREVINTVGYLDEKYKHFYSDKDYYHRAKQAGVKIVKFNNVLVEHRESATYSLLNKEELLNKDLA